MWVDALRGTLLLIFDILRALEQLRSQPNDTLYPPNLSNAIYP